MIGPDGVVPSQIVGVSALIFPCTKKISSGTGSPGRSRKKGCKWWCMCVHKQKKYKHRLTHYQVKTLSPTTSSRGLID